MRLNTSCGGWWWSKFNTLLGHCKLVKLSEKWQPEPADAFAEATAGLKKKIYFIIDNSFFYNLISWISSAAEYTVMLWKNWIHAKKLLTTHKVIYRDMAGMKYTDVK